MSHSNITQQQETRAFLISSAELLKVQRNPTWGGLASTRQAMCAVSILATPYTLTPRGMHTGGTAERQDRYLESFHIFTDIAFTGVIAHIFKDYCIM